MFVVARVLPGLYLCRLVIFCARALMCISYKDNEDLRVEEATTRVVRDAVVPVDDETITAGAAAEVQRSTARAVERTTRQLQVSL